MKRYTIRYERGTARLINGISLEPAILLNADNSGSTLDDACQRDGRPFYPQCWPPLGDSRCQLQRDGMKSLARESLPAAQDKKREVMEKISAMMKRDASYQ